MGFLGDLMVPESLANHEYHYRLSVSDIRAGVTIDGHDI